MTKQAKIKQEKDTCPCGSAKAYADCCATLHDGARKADTAEQLMRSRYSAFVKLNASYLLRTWSARTKPQSLKLEHTQWIGLKVKSTSAGLIDDSEGWVRFIARFKVEGKAHRLEEHSYFCRENGDWVYVNAVEA